MIKRRIGFNIVTDTNGVATPAKLQQMYRGGDCHESGETIIPAAWTDISFSGTGTFFHGFSAADGDLTLTWSWSVTNTIATAGTIVLYARGTKVLTIGNPANNNGQSAFFYGGDNVRWELWYEPSINSCGVIMRVNGAMSVVATSTTTGGPLAPPTAAWINSYGGNTNIINGAHKNWHSYAAGAAAPITQVPLVVTGDSLWADYDIDGSTASMFVAPGDPLASKFLAYTQAIPGENISQQTGHLAAARIDPNWVRLLILQPVINDLAGGVRSSVCATRMASQIATGKALFPNAKAAVRINGPVRKKVNDLYQLSPGTFSYAANSQDVWNEFLNYNDRVRGTNGQTQIVGIDYVIQSHYPLLCTVTPDFLDIDKQRFPTSGIGGTDDGSHPNRLGRTIDAAAAWNDAIVPSGAASFAT